MYKIVDEEISKDEVIERVNVPSSGAIVTFDGIVRGVSHGRKVLYLEYDAYKEMAEKKMGEIEEEIHDKWNLKDIVMVHRIGTLNVGETSVFIAVSAPHRGEAFEMCRYAIDRIKKDVPIWKKEVWENGEEWLGMQSEDN